MMMSGVDCARETRDARDGVTRRALGKVVNLGLSTVLTPADTCKSHIVVQIADSGRCSL